MLLDFIEGYITCALWASNDEKDEPLDKNYSKEDLHEVTILKMLNDCSEFYSRYSSYWEYANTGEDESDQGGLSDDQAGHDFWLTRNGHGAGFWDREGLTGTNSRALTEISRKFGEVYLYIGDDNKIHC